jgi:hypothetical protein
MKQHLEKFLEFNGKTLVFLSIKGVYWIALKPVCEALGIVFDRQLRTLKQDSILGPAWALQPMQVPGDQLRKMASLPEYLIYGWLFSIKSDSKELLLYKKECYEVLYKYFHSTITRRKKLFEEKAKIQTERNHLELDLRKQDNFIKLEDLRAREARIGKELKEIDTSELDEQLDMFKDQ